MHVIHLRIVCNTDTFVLLVGIVAYIFKKATPIFSQPEGGNRLATRQSEILIHNVGLSPGLAVHPLLSASVCALCAGRNFSIFRRTYGALSS